MNLKNSIDLALPIIPTLAIREFAGEGQRLCYSPKLLSLDSPWDQGSLIEPWLYLLDSTPCLSFSYPLLFKCCYHRLRGYYGLWENAIIFLDQQRWRIMLLKTKFECSLES